MLERSLELANDDFFSIDVRPQLENHNNPGGFPIKKSSGFSNIYLY